MPMHHRLPPQLRIAPLLLGLAALTASCAIPRERVAEPDPARPAVTLGVEALVDDPPAVLRGKRIGLITNRTALDGRGISTIDRLARHPELRLVALFAPEHGIRAAASGYQASGTDAPTGLPVHSLYGETTRKPTPAMLKGVDALVFDIQDVGARQYTYASTMALAMQAAAEQGIPFVVLDRPNPIGGEVVEGNVLDSAHASFVGMYPIASRHGMTLGELARMYNHRHGIGADLTVVPVRGWRRSMWYDETGLPFTPPSPNLRTLEAVIHYPGTVFLEPTNLSEGRGTDRPFEQTGAPWLRADEVTRRMNAMRLPGVRFQEVRIDVDPQARGRRYAGQTIPGVRLVLTDRAAYRPIDTSLRLINEIRHLHPDRFEWSGYETLLAGTPSLRAAIDAGRLDEWLTDAEAEARRFRAEREPYLLYR